MPSAALPRLALATAAALLLNGCAWLIGHGDVPQPASPVRVGVAAQSVSEGPLQVSGTWLGVGDRVVTARNMLGRVGRVVNPYGEDTFVISLRLENTGAEPLVVLPQAATLARGFGEPERARTLADYRLRWPTWAVTNSQESDDQNAAYLNVLNTLLLERVLAPGETVEGRLAFPAGPAREALTLRLPYRQGSASKSVSLTWSLQ